MSDNLTLKKLELNQLTWKCDESIFKFDSTAQVEPLNEIVGQPRAIEAIKIGAEIDAIGYNVFVTGLTGTGRTSAVEQILMQISKDSNKELALNDFCYVYNFSDPSQPILIRLNKGEGKLFSQEMDDAIHYLRSKLPKYFEDDAFQAARKKIIETYHYKEKSYLEEFDKKIQPFEFIRGQLEMESGILQPEVFPLIDGKPVRIDEAEDLFHKGKLSQEKLDEIIERYNEFHQEILELSRKGMRLMHEYRKEIIKSDQNSASTIVDSAFDDIERTFKTLKVTAYIFKIKEHILENLSLFVPAYSELLQVPEYSEDKSEYNDFSFYKVNVILDNSETESAPVIIETNPTYSNLFGNIEKTMDKRGVLTTDFTNIRAGTLLKADRGFLIVNANDLFSEPGVWQALKRVLLYNRLEIQPFDSYFQISQSALKPEKIKVNVKVIIIGGQTLYNALYHYEKGFKKIFKVNAQFDDSLKNSEYLQHKYAAFISKICKKEKLNHCSPSAVAAIIEWAVKSSESQRKITLRFSDVADLLREAAFYVTNGNMLINREDVETAIKQRIFRNNLYDEKVRESILENSVIISTEGKRVGQINGLTIYDTGNFSFGKPARITASVGAGNSTIINIEREADLSGKIHNKGVLIISGFLREKFARKEPLSLTASIAFEQNYGGIDGDSASAAEIYAVLSAIAQLPINQNIAITGSVNQKGDIQPIGGVNDKIRGFYEICKERGFTGNQAVIIPQQNSSDLLLENEIIADIENGNFAVYAISRIEDGVELLFDLPAGELLGNGKFTPNTLFDEVDKSLSIFRKDNKKKKEKEKNVKNS